MRFSKHILSFALLSILVPSASIAHASDVCKNVQFKVTNKHNSGGTIELHQVEYFNKANGQWKTEDLKDLTCYQGKTCTTSGDNLNDAEGMDLTKFRFVYRYKGTKSTDNWSDYVEGGIKEPDKPTCFEGKVYGGTSNWTIFGTD